MRSDALRVGRFVSGADDNTNLLNSGCERLFDQDPEKGFFVAVPIDKGLKRQCPLRRRGGSYDSFLDNQGGS